ncbi:hypothetical protein I4U23_010096 [Adineta vaga]|nr:hypothetical protein I4U23_010096 [Adineta vaga]
MDYEKLGNGELYKTTLLSDAVPSLSSSTAIGNVISNPIDECQISPFFSSTTRDSGCYSSTPAEEWHLMQPHLSMANHHQNKQKEQQQQQQQQEGQSLSHSTYPTLSRRSSESEPFDKVIINISGLRFEARASTLQRFPCTLLGDKQRRAEFFDYMNNEYFFERHRSSFEAILYFYQSGGRLTRPENISAEIFLEEIKFFDLGDEILKRYRKQEGYVEEIPIERPANTFQRKVWEAFECPESSNIARVIAIVSIVMIVVSIASFIIETLPSIRNEMTAPTILVPSNTSETGHEIRHGGETKCFWLFFAIETVCVTWFCFELVCRFLVAPSKFAFIKNGPNVIDVVSIIPYFLQLIGLIYQKKDSGVSGFSSTLTVLRIVRLVRVFRIFKLSRHFKGLQVLALTFLASWKELLLLMFFLFIIVVVFSSFMYFVEADYTNVSPTKIPTTATATSSYITSSSSISSLSNLDTNQQSSSQNANQFSSIPHSFWFSIITMTTVGYGDYVPRTNLGKVIGAICALTGVLTIALPVPIIVSNFTYFYQRQMEDNERQYQAIQRAHAKQFNQDKNQLGINNDKDHGPEYNEWETILNEPDYSDYREITHAVTKRLVRNAYFKAFRGSKTISPTMRYQTLAPTSPTYRIYQTVDDDYRTRESDLEKVSLLH